MSEGQGSGGKLRRLEQLRGAASAYVFVHHYVRHNLPEAPGVARYFVLGQVAVLLFFLLSGFVIHYAALRRGSMTARDYFVRRFRRIYPVFGVALGLSYLAASVRAGAWLGPDVRALALNLLQVQGLERSPGSWVAPYMGNEPLWSLSFEWWFYVLFFFLYVATPGRGVLRRRLALGVSLLGFVTDVAWPNPLSLISSYFVLWWAGAEMGREWVERGRITLRAQLPALGGAVVVTAGWCVVAAWQAREAGSFDAYHHPGITARHFITTLVVIGGGWAWMRLGGFGADFVLRPFGFVAPFSYALYVFHLPCIHLVSDLASSGYGTLDLLWLTPVLFGLCWVVEQPVQRWVNRWIR